MKTVAIRILVTIFNIIYIKNYAQTCVREYCYNQIDNAGIKTELKFEVFADSTYKWKSQILSSPKYRKIKKIENTQSGKIINNNGKFYLDSNNDNNPDNEFEIKLTKSKLKIIGSKREKRFLSNDYHYVAKKLIFRRNRCEKQIE